MSLTIPPPPIRRARRRSAIGVVAVVVGSTLVAGATAAPPSSAAAELSAPASGLVAEYLFDQTTGTSVPDSAGGGLPAATVVNGADTQWTGSSLVLSGGPRSGAGNWVHLPDDLLTDATSATVTIETKLDASMKNSWNFLWNIGNASTTQYYFASVRDLPRTAITVAGGGGEVNARSGTALDPERWYSLTSVIDGESGRITFYIDGEEVGSAPTSLTPAAITDQTLNTIGRAPYDDPLYRGEVAAFRVYDRALSPEEVSAVSDADAAIHADSFQQAAQTAVDAVAELVIDDRVTTLPDYGGRITWSSADPGLVLSADGRTLTVTQPAVGADPVSGTLTATATVRGATATRDVAVTIRPDVASDAAYGYAMVHFIEDSAGYAEKIYLDVSRGDNPEQWDPLNSGEPILASHLGTTGVRDPYLTYDPESETYYIIATDLRVFGGDRGSGSCVEWCHWSSRGSTKLNVWESKDLVSWSDVRQIDVATAADGTKAAELGMAWAPEATWIDDYYPDGRGAFVVYWSSNMYANPEHTGSSYSRVLWGATLDFTQETYEYGGVFIDGGGNTIDTTITQHEGTTYRVTKDNSQGKGLYMESTTAARWWEPAAEWTTLQTRIGAEWANGDAGGVEGPAVFKRHDEDRWYLYVDVIPTTGYRPMVTTDLDDGWSLLQSPDFSMAPSTKHGGIIPLTRAQYDEIRGADATAAVAEHLGTVEVAAGADEAALRDTLPATAEVTLTYERGTATRPVDWDISSVQADVPGSYEVTGVVRTIGANLNQWVGAGGSTAHDAPDRTPYSSTAITVTAEVVVTGAPVSVTTDARCIAGRTVLTVRVANDGDAAVAVEMSTAFGSKTLASLAPGKGSSAAFTTRQVTIPADAVELSATIGADTLEWSEPYAAHSCG